MTKTKTILLGSTLFLFNACAPTSVPVSEGGYYNHGIYFGVHLTEHNKEGIQDGCTTSKGIYTKKHWLFKHSKEYKNGWFSGRNKCKELLEIDENGDLVL